MSQHRQETRRGMLIGTVELYDCDEGDWMLRDPSGRDAAHADEAPAAGVV